jgi:hypothetical protein
LVAIGLRESAGFLETSTTGATPKIEAWLPRRNRRNGIGIVICPGGGYGGLDALAAIATVRRCVDCRDLTFGKWDKVRADMDRTFAAARKHGGVIFVTGNHLPGNIPEAMMEKYIAHFVEVIEPMGSESYIYFRLDDTTFISRVDAHRRFQVGETAEPAVFIGKAHFFDPATERRIA